MIEIKEITKRYQGIPVVNNISFQIKPSEVVGFLGPNGAGKTTAIKIMATLIEPTKGKIFFKEKNIRDNILQYKKSIGYVPEEPKIYGHMSAYEYLLMVGRLRSLPNNILEPKITLLMKFLDLSLDMNFLMSTYSKGMIQKVLLAAAILHNPDILFFDEPLSGLDVGTSAIIKEIIKMLAQEGKIVFFCSHVLEQVENICKRVIIIHKGKVIADDSVENLKILMNLPSLEEVFNQLLLRKDPEKIARKLVNAIKI
jgi:ABC-2 type transport system ATP-binding protein